MHELALAAVAEASGFFMWRMGGVLGKVSKEGPVVGTEQAYAGLLKALRELKI